IRRHIHANPELSFFEEETAQFIQSKLDEIGVPYIADFAGHGIVVKIEGKNPAKKIIALRADIDALPITEANDISYKSTNEGVMHACGHDVHTANLLGVIKILNELKNEFEGTVKCIFQPAEEKFPGGASLMIKEGVLKNPEPTIIIGQHVHPPMNVGNVGFAEGKYMASADEIFMTIHGKGGHAAAPRNFIDPILMTSQIIVALQQVVSRLAPPETPTVLSFGKINSVGGYNNIIPEAVKLDGTFRTMEEDWRYEAHKHIKRIAESTAHANGGSVDVQINVGYPHLINQPDLTNRCRKYAKDFLGNDRVEELPIRMGAEDFAYYSHQIPGCFYRLGIKNEALGINSGLHTPTFNIDEDAFKTGVGLMAWLAICELNN
ncbi:UNVERIFIED_CONTAM: hypothetical protein GTU68_031887, partial [Idotea baltica]|nr:hypothetical protein [Idotea baltica]